MTALSGERTDIKKRIGGNRTWPVAANAVIYKGAMVALNATGYLEPATTAADITVVGVAKESVNNTGGADGDASCRIEQDNCWLMKNSAAADAIADTERGQPCYAVDDQTVAKTDGAASRSVAGTVDQVDAEGVWVRFV